MSKATTKAIARMARLLAAIGVLATLVLLHLQAPASAEPLPDYSWSRPERIHSVKSGNCLGLEGRSTSKRTRVVAERCDDSTTQMWRKGYYWDGQGRVRVQLRNERAGKCLGLAPPYYGTRFAHIWDCVNTQGGVNDSQLWRMSTTRFGGHQLANVQFGECLAAHGYGAGSAVRLDRCDPNLKAGAFGFNRWKDLYTFPWTGWMRLFNHWHYDDSSLDFVPIAGTDANITAIADGSLEVWGCVDTSRTDGGVTLKADTGEEFRYTHLDLTDVRRLHHGQRVTKGQFLANLYQETYDTQDSAQNLEFLVDTCGWSSDRPHLHLTTSHKDLDIDGTNLDQMVPGRDYWAHG